MGGLNDFLFGSGDKTKKVDNYNPGQNKFLDQFMQLLSSGGQEGMQKAMGLLQQYLDPNSEVYKNFEQPYLNEFNNKTIPGIAERFAGGGANGGALSSSGFGQALSTAGSDLQTNLAQMKSGLQMGAANSLMSNFQNMSQIGLGAQPYGYQTTQGNAGLFPQLGGAALQGWGMGGFQNPFKK